MNSSLDCTRKTRIIDVVYNASNNELVRTKTLVKNCIVLIDATPYRSWYENYYAQQLGRKKGIKLVSIVCCLTALLIDFVRDDIKTITIFRLKLCD